ncbi:hypothetical protein EFM11_10300 [Lactobacillus helveticus]|nr:putative cross-wall-targeting lipoprotein signal domain-containing proteiin [Lactobacillus helveticus]MCT0165652.1 hypothetical protein [Lactobacillus helveticus]
MTRTIAHKRLVVGEKKQRFGFRKTILGLCGAILGSTLLMVNAANNANTVHADEFGSGEKGVTQTKASATKDTDPDPSKDPAKTPAKTPVEAKSKGNESINTANGLNSKARQPLDKKEVPQQLQRAGADKNQNHADKGAQGYKSADVADKYVPNQNPVPTHSMGTVTGKPSASKALATDKEALTHVTKNNFLDYFSLNGSATYDKNTGIVTITPDDYSKIGNFSLKSKLDMNTSFILTGKVNLGSHSPYGADGIGFTFHNGNTTDIGNAGGNLGIGGLQNALGFKLDTWTNGYQAPLSDKDGSQIDPTDSSDFGWNGDSMNAPYGTFVDTENTEVATKDGKKFKDGGLKMLMELPKR